MTESVFPPQLLAALKPEFVAPLVLYLCHESSKENGGIYEVGAGFIAKVRLQRSRGAIFPINKDLTPEQIRDGFNEVIDFSEGATNPAAINEATAAIMQRVLNQNSEPPRIGQSVKKTSAVSQVFNDLKNKIQSNPGLVKQVAGVFIFVIGEETWVIDLQSGAGSVTQGKPPKNPPGSCQITVSGDDFVQLMTGQLDPMEAFSQGKVKLDGNKGLAMKLQLLTKAGAKL